MSFIREPAVSGSFYPENPVLLRKSIEKYLENVEVMSTEHEVVGLISPHAGYMYSGQVAAYGYKALMNKMYETAIIVAPSHRLYFEGVSVMESGGYKTPLGITPIDEDLSRKILSFGSKFLFSDKKAHMGEHSLEVQIPFLQMVLRDFKIVPMIMGAQKKEIWREVSSVIGSVAQKEKKKIIFVASSDLSHYYPYEKAKRLDSLVLRYIEAFDIEGMERDFETQAFEACGGGPMITIMLISKFMGAKRGIVLNYANSGDVSGEKSSVVGYVSAIFVK